jgi:hypothetical protein
MVSTRDAAAFVRDQLAMHGPANGQGRPGTAQVLTKHWSKKSLLKKYLCLCEATLVRAVSTGHPAQSSGRDWHICEDTTPDDRQMQLSFFLLPSVFIGLKSSSFMATSFLSILSGLPKLYALGFPYCHSCF